MAERLGPLEIECDCPPYAIVQATRRIGLATPEDVRWCRLSHFLAEPPTWRELFHLGTLKQLLGLTTAPLTRDCFCARPLPCMARYSFTNAAGIEHLYLLGQCARCRTVFWDHG